MNQINPYGAYARTDMYGRPLPQQIPPYLQYQMQPYAPIPQEPVQQPMTPATPQPQIACEIVGDYETVRAAKVGLDGQPKYYPLTDGTKIYRKQLMADGTSKIFEYALVTDSEPKQATAANSDLSNAIKAIDSKMEALTSRVDEFMNMWGGNENVSGS